MADFEEIEGSSMRMEKEKSSDGKGVISKDGSRGKNSQLFTT